MIEVDRIAEANEAIDRRARQRHAAALAQQELTPEAIKAEEERQARYAGGVLEDAPAVTETVGDVNVEYPPSLEERLADALQPVLDVEPNIVGIGRSVFQWILVPSEDEENNPEGYQLGLQLQVDEQPPAGFVVEITPAMLEGWARGKGLQGNRVEHKQFVSALFERAVAVGMNETGNQLVYVLEQLMLGEPTRTSVGDDEPELPEMSD